jgi:hypothetical protein
VLLETGELKLQYFTMLSISKEIKAKEKELSW